MFFDNKGGKGSKTDSRDEGPNSPKSQRRYLNKTDLLLQEFKNWAKEKRIDVSSIEVTEKEFAKSRKELMGDFADPDNVTCLSILTV